MVNRTVRKNQATVHAIVSAAEDLLAEGGAAAVTLEALSERADVAVQTIYNRIGGRPAVLMAVAEHAFSANREYLDAAYASDSPPPQRLREVAAAYVRFALEQPQQFRFLAFPPPDAPAVDSMVTLVREQNGKLAALLREAMDSGYCRTDLDPDLAATVLWRMWDGVLGLMYAPEGLRPTDDALRAALDVLEKVTETGLGLPTG